MTSPREQYQVSSGLAVAAEAFDSEAQVILFLFNHVL